MSSPIIFDAATVAARLTELKTANTVEPWYKNAVNIDTTSVRRSEYASWLSMTYTDASGVTAPLNLKFTGEKQSSNLPPSKESDLPPATGAFIPKVRTTPATISIAKFAVTVQTVPNDRLQVVTDHNGVPIYPSDDKLSAVYKVFSLLNEIIRHTFEPSIEKGEELILRCKTLLKERKEKKDTPDAEEFINSLSQGLARNAFIIADSDIKTLRDLFGDKVTIITKSKFVLILPTVKINNLCPLYISEASGAKAGVQLPNPTVRIKLALDNKNDANNTQFYKMVSKPERVYYTPDTIHTAITNTTLMDGIINCGNICCSKQGISLPATVKILVVTLNTKPGVITIDDMGYNKTEEKKQEQAPAPGPDAAAEDASYENLLSDLG